MLKKISKICLQYYLKFLAKLVLRLRKPRIIAIAGSTNKSFIKESVKKTLCSAGLKAGAAANGFNTEIGLSLAILGLNSGYNSYRDWWPIIKNAPFKLFKKNYPEILILELGVSDPGDMKFLLSIIEPEIAVIADINKRYLESFSDVDKMTGEYRQLVQAIKKSGLVVLNSDNETVKDLSKSVQSEIKYFGHGECSDFKIISEKHAGGSQQITIQKTGDTIEFKLNRPGAHHVYAELAALIIRDYVSKKFEKSI